MLRFRFTLFVLLCSNFIIGQDPLISRFLDEMAAQTDLLQADIQNIRITDDYVDSKSGIRYVYLQQTVDDVPVDYAINSIYINQKGKVKSVGNRFIRNIRSKISEHQSVFSPLQCVQKSAVDLGYSGTSSLRSIIPVRSNAFQADFAEGLIEVEPIYIISEGQLVLCNKFLIKEIDNPDYWEFKVDVSTGEIREKTNYTIYCQPGYAVGSGGRASSERFSFDEQYQTTESSSYRVFPLPLMNPSEGDDAVVVSPFFTEASPFGWHDTDGAEGPEFTITRGNNVHAYKDDRAFNSSANDEPDGGAELVFDFTADFSQEVEFNDSAALVNLFYTSNMAHDLSYLLGFREESGNYQQNNYGDVGRDGDFVRAEGMDGSGRNNANFTVTRDGSPGRMQMYLFDKVRSLVAVEEPEGLTTNVFETSEANFGSRIRNNPLTAEIVQAITDDPEFPNQGCSNIVNNLFGKIALMDRGICDFSEKVFRAQQGGAVMAIICNIAGVDGGDGEELFVMGGGVNANEVSIPSVMMKKSDCDLLKISLATGQKVIMHAEEQPIEGPSSFDANFDNGIILHEYVHGISTRLTGGPSNPSCLNNIQDGGQGLQGEQMGEGWSDFFALVWTSKEGDAGDIPRGMGTYVLDQGSEGEGIRAVPYTIDMNVNSLTYNDIKVASVPHGVGTVWSSMLWDLYWAFIDQYGFDSNYQNENSGNFKAAYLVVEAMKMQPCRPGFVDGRNAILEADQLLFDGIHEQMIWEVFARRGLGFYAEQGSTLDHRDGKEDFTLPPFIRQELEINMSTTNNVRPGEIVDIQVKYSNFTGVIQNNVVIEIDIPTGLVYVDGSGTKEPITSGDKWIFMLGNLNPMAAGTISFQALTSDRIFSVRNYYNDVESGVGNWTVDQKRGDNQWRTTINQSLSGNQAWFVPEAGNAENLSRLISPKILVEGARPVFRFWHKYKIREAINGGFVEISTDGDNWDSVGDKLIIRNEYSSELPYLAFGIPNLMGYSGENESEQFIDSYIDLKEFNGQEVQFRFRFSQQPGYSDSGENAGWLLDDFELLDLMTYTLNACIYADGIFSEICTAEKEIVINTETTTNVVDNNLKRENILLFPNPTSDILQVVLEDDIPNKYYIQILDADGKIIQELEGVPGQKTWQFEVKNLPSGQYVLRITGLSSFGYQKFQVVH